MPRSGVWGMHIVDVSANGLCADFAPDVAGRVLRLDVDANRSGELALGLLGIDLYGGHADGIAWADLELPLPWWAYDVGVSPDIPMDEPERDESEEDRGEEDGDGDEDWGEGEVPDEDGDAPPPCMELEEDPYESADPESAEDPGLHLAFDADVASAFSMHGTLALTVSTGYGSCTFEALVDAAYIGEEGDVDDDFGEAPVVVVEESVPGSAGDPYESDVDEI